jgi:hypothetical protein
MFHLKEAEVPHWPFGKVALFVTAESALKHLCDHLLTRPEAHYWAELIPALSTWVQPTDDNSLYRFARAVWSPRPPAEAVQELYDGYASVIVEAMSDAIHQGWFWAQDEPDGPCWRGLGISGTYVIWREHAIRTAMLLGYTAPPALMEPDERKTNPLPRQHAWKYRGAQIRHDHTWFPPVQGDSLSVRYHVFKKGAVRVRREYKHAWESGKVVGGGSFLGSLLHGVPDFDTWQRLQQSAAALASAGLGGFSLN